jgi:glycosyltransferase involved in cell wall biosynthesis
MISIVLPVFNGERYLEQAINSCIAQTFVDWELIIVDDASTDSTSDIIDKFVKTDSRITKVKNEENKKLPGSLNAGFACARGAYLTWTSDDNLYRPEALAVMVSFLEQHREFSVVYADYQVIDENGTSLRRFSVPPPEELVLCNAIGACFLYRRTIHEALNGYDESRFLVEDYDFWLRASQRFRIAPPLPTVLYDYRIHGKTLTAMRGYEIQNALILLLARHLPEMGWAGRRKVAQGYAWLGDATISNGLSNWGWFYYFMATLKWPSMARLIYLLKITVYFLKKKLLGSC